MTATHGLWARSNAALEAFNSGVQAFNAKQFNEAIPHFDDAISEDSEFAEAYFARGACKYYLKSLDGAMMDLSDALRLKPDYTDALALRGAVNYEADRWDNALEDFNAVLAKNPNDAQSLIGRAVILLKRQDLTHAARDFKAFLRARPDDPLAPKIKELLASLKRPATEEEQTAQETPAAGGEAPAQHVHRTSAPRGHALTAAQLQQLADSLFAQPLSRSYDRKVLNGERAEAVGDIRSVPGVPGDNQSGNDQPQIVEPK